MSRTPALRAAVLVATALAIAALFLFWWYRGILHPHLTGDAAAYWSVRDGVLYEGTWLQEQRGLAVPFVYSPAFAQLIMPLALLPLGAFVAAWLGLLTAATAWVAGPILAAVLVFTYPPLAANNLAAGQIMPLMALALALAPRHPAAWSFLLLTKVTPGIGIAWHAARREWRALAVALGATAGIVVVSALLFGVDHWLAWLGLLTDAAGTPSPYDLPGPRWLHVAVGGAIATLAGWRGWAWLLPFGVMLAMPHGGLGNTPILLAAIPLARQSFGSASGRNSSAASSPSRASTTPITRRESIPSP